ncbi:Unsaturated rhamnogalacturonyl hydrolase YesR [Cyphellophora attinorum]|uniref:Unsaturated rhamnogalacturonyl hydrolase YesR n=1 Tax=Cyphellophora attinorum TaxID=1664694 RepID=A0A0N1HPR9_9EURO|nr:Unsaturated rhamnogalacturonyl hydrolase YesR [Phialophora attinorum]KPI39785.1 Unsaturated rhamnogalacturonyl hydrolase YesR [Phialophora attinorum]
MPTPLRINGLTAADTEDKIELLISNLVSIKDTTGKFLMPLADGRVIDTKGWNDWEWTHGIGLYGLYQYQFLRPLSRARSVIKEWFDGRLAEGTTKNINTMAAMLTLAFVYEEDPHGEARAYRPWLEQWAEWAMHDLPRTKGGGFQHVTYDLLNEDELWDDTLMMTALPLAKIGMVLGRPSYVEEAKRQFLIHVNYLQDRKTGLWFHGWKFDDGADHGVGHNFADVRWARGNAWITIAIPEFLEIAELPEGDALRMYLVEVLRAQCAALKKHQLPNGMWNTVLDVEDDRNYEEASATAGFAYGLLKAARQRLIGKEYVEVAMKAINAVLDRIGEDGELSDTSFGTAVGQSLEHYFAIPRTSMPYGQAMAMMALVELRRAFI